MFSLWTPNIYGQYVITIFLAYIVDILLHMLISSKNICSTILFIPGNSSNVLIISC